eukprot:scaffold90043_cov25-Tisochrysis_lutea.AAC.4
MVRGRTSLPLAVVPHYLHGSFHMPLPKCPHLFPSPQKPFRPVAACPRPATCWVDAEAAGGAAAAPRRVQLRLALARRALPPAANADA